MSTNYAYVDKSCFRNFILGGKSEFYLENTETDNRFHFFVRASDNKNLFFIHLINDDLKVSKYLGYISRGFIFNKGKKGEGSEQMLPIKALVYTLKYVDKLPDSVRVQHLGKCSRCGRKLKDAESIARGLGPECYKKVNF